MNGRALLIPALALVIAAGCWDQRVVDQVEYIVNIGIDARPDGKALIAMTTPSLQTGEQPKPTLFMTETETVREAREKIRRQTGGQLEAGKLEQAIFGEAMARRGILDHLEIFARDPVNPLQAWIVITRGTARDFFEQAVKWRNMPLPGVYLQRLLNDAAASGDVPRSNIHIFLRDYYAPGVDPMLPLLEATRTRANVLGSALLRDDKLVGELTTDETYLVMVLQGKAAMHNHPLPVPRRLARGKREMVVRFNSGKARTRLRIKDGLPEVAFEVKFQALLTEFHLGRPITDRMLQDLEASVAGTLEKQFAEVWAKLRQVNADPIGLGNQVRAKHSKYWREHDWREIFPRIEARFKVEVDILNHGMIR